jgi:pimeloyl-ACP methyl ester carboxylesterase
MRRKLGFLFVAVCVALAFGMRPRPLRYDRIPGGDRPFDVWSAERLEESRTLGVRPGDEERLVRRAPGRTPLAILYLHGFGAARAEGEETVDWLSEELGANAWFLRLPGHGLDDPEALASLVFADWLDAAEHTFAQMGSLGDRVVLVGSSMGGLLATWLAAEHPNRVAAVILASPFYDWADPLAGVMERPIGPPLVRVLYGDLRDAGWTEDPEGRKQPGYEEHWTITQRYAALETLGDLRRFVSRPAVLARVRAPTLLLYHYADDSRQDDVASVQAMQEAFGSFQPHEASRAVPIADGNHILLSSYVRTDKVAIRAAVSEFVEAASLR